MLERKMACSILGYFILLLLLITTILATFHYFSKMEPAQITVDMVQQGAVGAIALESEQIYTWKINNFAQVLESSKNFTGGKLLSTSFNTFNSLGIPLTWNMKISVNHLGSSATGGTLNVVRFISEIVPECLSNKIPSGAKFFVNFKFDIPSFEAFPITMEGDNYLKEMHEGMSPALSQGEVVLAAKPKGHFHEGHFFVLRSLYNGCLVVRANIKIYADLNSIQMALTKTNHRMKNCHNLAFLWENPVETGADCAVVSKTGFYFWVHKTVLLLSGIEAFRDRLTSSMDERKFEVINMDDISSEALRLILVFIYKGEVPPYIVGTDDDEGENASQGVEDRPFLSEVLYAARKYKIHDLLAYFDNTIGRLCNEENVAFLLRLANKFGLPKAQRDIEACAKANPGIFSKIVQTYQNE